MILLFLWALGLGFTFFDTLHYIVSDGWVGTERKWLSWSVAIVFSLVLAVMWPLRWLVWLVYRIRGV